MIFSQQLTGAITGPFFPFTFPLMEPQQPKELWVNRLNLVRPKTYANRVGLTERAIKYQIARKELATEEIDGVVFVRLK